MKRLVDVDALYEVSDQLEGLLFALDIPENARDTITLAKSRLDAVLESAGGSRRKVQPHG